MILGIRCWRSNIKLRLFGYELRRILRDVESFGKQRTCHPQGEYVLVSRSGPSYTGQEVGGALKVMALIGGVEELAAIQ
jgi:hypothetical protein